MPFQAPHYIYPIPEKQDYAGAIQSGIATGLKIKAGAQGQEEEKRKRMLEKDIGDIYTNTEAELAKIPKDSPAQEVKAPETGSPGKLTETDVVKMAAVSKDQPEPALGAQRAAPDGEAAKSEQAAADNKNRRLEINAQMHNKIIGAHIKHGDYKGAEEIKSKYMASVEKLATISPEAAEKVWNNSFLKDEYGGIDLKGLKSDWKLEISKDGSTALKINTRTGKVEPVEVLKSADQVKQLKEGDSLVMIDPKDGKVTEVYKNSKPDPVLSAEKAYIQGMVEKGVPVDVAVKSWQQVKNSGKTGSAAGGDKKTALEKNIKFLSGLGLTNEQAMSYLEKGRQSKSQFVAGVYRDVLRNEGSDASGVERAKAAAEGAGTFYDSIGGETAAPSTGVAAKVAKPTDKAAIPTDKVDPATERAKAAAAIKARPDQAAFIKKRFQEKTGKPY